MDIKKYIASGILENYALGLVSEKERQEVEQLAMEYPEIRAELDEVEAALGKFAEAEAMELPEGLAEAALEKVDKIAGKTRSIETVENPKSEKSSFPLNILLSILTAILGVSCVYFFNQNQTLKLNLENTNSILDTLKQDCDEQAQYVQFLEREMGILQDTSTQTIYMKGVPTKDPNAIAAIHYNPRTQKTYLDIRSLPEPPTDKQYQLWALVDGKPIDMGVFDLQITGDTSFIEVPFIQNAGAFAVTLEDAGGKSIPDLTQLYVIGNV